MVLEGLHEGWGAEKLLLQVQVQGVALQRALPA